MRRAVKSRTSGARAATALFSAWVGLAVLSGPPGLRLGLREVWALEALNPRLPTGAEEVVRLRPEGPDDRFEACSFRFPACVRGVSASEGQAALSWLSKLELAYFRLVHVLRLPAPVPSLNGAPHPGLDLYLEPGNRTMQTFGEATDIPLRSDSAPAFCVVGTDVLPTERAATLCVGEAIAFRLDASETPFVKRALATELWLTVGEPSSLDAARIADFASHPERAVVARERTPDAEGAALLLEFLDRARGQSFVPDAAVAAVALSSRAASATSLRYTNEPDLLDVLRASFGPTPTDVAAFFGRFAVQRARVGAGDPETAFAELAWVGDFGKPRLEWSVPLSSLPRRLSPSRPVEPTGATYVWLDFDRDPEKARLSFSADWEPPAAFQWELAILGRSGKIRRLITAPYLERGTSIQQSVAELEGARGVLIAGTNLGGLGPSFPFDPDFEPYEPHSYVVSLAVE